MAEYFVKLIRKLHPKLWKDIRKQQKLVKKQRKKAARAAENQVVVEPEWIICAPQRSSLLKQMTKAATGRYNFFFALVQYSSMHTVVGVAIQKQINDKKKRKQLKSGENN